MGDVTDFSNFMGAVIDDRAFAKHKAAITRAKRQQEPRRSSPAAQVDDSVGYFVRPTSSSPPTRPTQMFTTEYFGPILAVHVYDDARLREGRRADGVVRAVRPDRRDHRPGPRARSPGRREELRFAAGNFYINDKPTGAVVGQQPFGGGRASRHQRQGRRRGQPAALDLAALDQGDVRAADGLPLPVHGLTE